MLSSIFVAIALVASPKEENFDYYLTEFSGHYLTESHPMAQLIEERLATSLFETSSKSEFLDRIYRLNESFKQRPERLSRFSKLNDLLQKAFQTRLAQARTFRRRSAVVGAIAGALLAIPIGKQLGTTKTLWLAVPTGMIAGAGVGFLLGHFLSYPSYEFSDELIARDVDIELEEIENNLKTP